MMKIYKSIIGGLYACETLSLTLWEENRLRVLENRVLRRISGLERKQWEAGENCTMRSFITYLIGKPEERDHLEDPGADGIFEWMFGKQGENLWPGNEPSGTIKGEEFDSLSDY
jgi:hypothetical protein